MLGLVGKMAGALVGVESGPESQSHVDQYFNSFEPSLQYLEKFTGKNVLITGSTGGIGS